MLYSAVRRFLFTLDPETSHRVALAVLEGFRAIGLTRLVAPPPSAPRRVMGIDFPNPVGIAAGFDKNAEHINLLAALGFGFVEVGTVTPRAQTGNPAPRLFRIPEHEALINRFGFSNVGLDQLLHNVQRAKRRCVLGINIGKNADTPNERAADDYLTCLRGAYPHADYIAVNISSPNTPKLRELQNARELAHLLMLLKREQGTLARTHGRYVPLAVKIAPDLSRGQVQAVANLLLEHGMDGAIATNTTVSRAGVEASPVARETGGLSGAPLRSRSTTVLRQLCAALRGKIPVIGVGGILHPVDALEKLDAGASLVQIYTGLIYRGPGLLREIVRATVPREGP